MDNAKVEELLASAGKEKRAEVLGKLKAAKTQEERLAIAKEYFSGNEPEWLEESYELTDEELEMVAGGGAPWDNEIDENCCY